MCGIYGWQMAKGQHLSIYEATVFTSILADGMADRGKQSYGGAVWPRVGDAQNVPTIYRGTGSIIYNGHELLKATAKADMVLVHTRQGTHGKICVENCHPFAVGDVLGVHNGVIFNHEAMNKKYERTFDVDSQHIFAHINEDLSLDELDGYGAIVYARASEQYKALYFGKSTNGSFNVARIYRRKATDPSQREDHHIGILWASTWNELTKAVDLAGFKYASVDIQSEKIFIIEGGEVFNSSEKFKLSTKNNANVKKFERTTGGNASHSSVSKTPTVYDNNDGYWAHGKWHKWDDNITFQGRQAMAEDEEEKPTHTAAQEDDDRLLQVGKELTLYQKMRHRAGSYLHENGKAEKFEVRVALPLEINLRSDTSFPRCFLGVNKKQLICPACDCPIAEHNYGYCFSDNPACKQANMLEGMEPCTTDAPACDGCGHYLINGIHKAVNMPTLWCVMCGDYCKLPEEINEAEVCVAEVVTDDTAAVAATLHV